MRRLLLPGKTSLTRQSEMDNNCVGEGSGKSLPQWRRHLTGMPASPVKHLVRKELWSLTIGEREKLQEVLAQKHNNRCCFPSEDAVSFKPFKYINYLCRKQTDHEQFAQI